MRPRGFGVALLGAALLGACSSSSDPQAPGSMPESGAEAGASTGPSPLSINGCSPDGYEDHSDEADARVVQVGAEGLKFTPPCLLVAVGQAVLFEGNLSAHPLAPGRPDDASAGSPANPIIRTSSGNSATFSFERAGTFPYFCELHGFGSGMGMVGAIYVR